MTVDRDEIYHKIDSRGIGFRNYLLRLWQYKYLVWVFAKRDLKVKYAQTLLGISWSVLQPVTGMLIFSFFFTQVFKVNTEGMPYALFVLTGLIVWYFFTYVAVQGGMSLLQAQETLTKMSFPKIILPIAKIVLGLVELGLSMLILIGLAIFYGIHPQWHFIFLPFILAIHIIVSFTLSLWFSLLTIQYRDLQHLIPYMVSFGIWCTPVFYTVETLPEFVRPVLAFNPIAAVIGLYRFALLGTSLPSIESFYCLGVIFGLFVLGVYYFYRTDSFISDSI